MSKTAAEDDLEKWHRECEEATRELATKTLGMRASGDGFFFKSERKLQVFARLCELGGALCLLDRLLKVDEANYESSFAFLAAEFLAEITADIKRAELLAQSDDKAGA